MIFVTEYLFGFFLYSIVDIWVVLTVVTKSSCLTFTSREESGETALIPKELNCKIPEKDCFNFDCRSRVFFEFFGFFFSYIIIIIFSIIRIIGHWQSISTIFRKSAKEKTLWYSFTKAAIRKSLNSDLDFSRNPFWIRNFCGIFEQIEEMSFLLFVWI